MRMAQTVTDMEERLNWSNRAFQIVEAINPQALSPEEARTLGTLHAIRGQAYLELRARDYASFSRLAVSDLEAATTYLTTEDGTYWSQAMNLLSLAYYKHVDSNRADNIENAIKTAEAALSAIDPLRDRGVWTK
jgi:hypothetical protein